MSHLSVASDWKSADPAFSRGWIRYEFPTTGVSDGVLFSHISRLYDRKVLFFQLIWNQLAFLRPHEVTGNKSAFAGPDQSHLKSFHKVFKKLLKDIC